MTQHLISTRASGGTCAACKTSTLVAYCEGLRVRVDVTPIDATGEVAALAEGRATYTLIMAGELVHRDQFRIQDPHLAGTVHRQHRCPADQVRWRRRVDRANFATARSAGLATRHARRLQHPAPPDIDYCRTCGMTNHPDGTPRHTRGCKTKTTAGSTGGEQGKD
jgi:hypothetical protein